MSHYVVVEAVEHDHENPIPELQHYLVWSRVLNRENDLALVSRVNMNPEMLTNPLLAQVNLSERNPKIFLGILRDSSVVKRANSPGLIVMKGSA
jgi:hypothetical protein